uniref:Crossover junction endonuclease MUS81 n=1 Tax=Spongospora subterranea TaxID=70186 RepID=A0A0H5QI22_9EUKA|eukprot:CRZ01705.1 hypothetical protein [Spongospora subterranea]
MSSTVMFSGRGRGGRRGRGKSSASSKKDNAEDVVCFCPYNEFIAAGVLELIHSQNPEANANITSTFWKALSSIQKSPIPLKSVDDVKKLKFVGVYLCNEIVKIIKHHGLVLAPPPTKSFAAGPVEEASHPPAKRARTKKAKEYIPRFMSGAYAILVAMAQHDRSYRKGELITAAQPFSESSFTAIEVNGNESNFYNAWSGSTTLISNGLITKMGSPARYQLTDTGRILATRLLGDWQNQNALAEHPPRAPEVTASLNVFSPIETNIVSKVPGNFTSNFEIVLIVDSAEQFRNATNKVIDEFHSRALKAERYNLAIGDYCWVARPTLDTTLANCVVLPPIIERKKGADFAESIRDSRYEEQKFRLKRTGMPIVYLLEGDINANHVMDPRSLISAVSKMTVRDGFFVYRTKDIDNSIRFLHGVHEQIILSVAQNGIPSDAEPLGRFNQRLAKSFVPDKSLRFGNMLMSIAGISSYKCKAIIDRHPTLRSLLNAYDACPDRAAQESLLESIVFLSNGITQSKVGIAASKSIRSFFKDSSYRSKRGGSEPNPDM